MTWRHVMPQNRGTGVGLPCFYMAFTPCRLHGSKTPAEVLLTARMAGETPSSGDTTITCSLQMLINATPEVAAHSSTVSRSTQPGVMEALLSDNRC